MLLRLLSVASYLSRPKSGSVSGSFHYLSRYDTPTFINAPISCSSYRIPVVCSSVQEAEYGGLFAAAKIALDERRILQDLGYPQPPTTILCDNEFAVGLAQRTLTPKLSKSIDMRFHWLQDRVRQQQFRVHHVPGVLNLADYFTESLPLYNHTQFAPYIASDSANAPPPAFLPTTVST
jgi:hypothetical protein